MTNTIDFITELFFKVDNSIDDKKHSQAKLYPSEVVTIGLLYALKGCGQNNFWRWLTKDYRPLFLPLPCKTRLFRLLNSHRHYIKRFLADPSIIGVIDTYGIELIHPIREGRSDKQNRMSCFLARKANPTKDGLLVVNFVFCSIILD